MSWRVAIAESGASFHVAPGEAVLQAALRQGVELKHECTFGGCGTCRVKLLEGKVEYEEMPLALSPEEQAAGYALMCQARAISDLVLSTGPQARVPASQLCSAVVRGTRQLTTDIVQLDLEIEADGFDYTPGQHMNILLDDGGARSFSMASVRGPGNIVDFHVRQIPGGRFTARTLPQLAAGDRLAVEAPLGDFRLQNDDYRQLLLVATGTGIAPVKCMLESLMGDRDCPPVSLYWGMRNEAELYLADEIAGWRDRLYEFNFVPVLSRAGDSWRGRRGHVQDAVAQDFGDLSDHSIYLCGSPTMIADAKRRFAGLAASLDHVHADGFSFHHEVAA